MNTPRQAESSSGAAQSRGHRRQWAVIGVALLAIALLGVAVRSRVDGLALVVRAADLQGVTRRMADLHAVRIAQRLVDIPLSSGPVRARVYTPVTTPRQTVLLVSGLHPAGIDEPRLISLATTLAEANVTVVTPDLAELSRFEITPVLTDHIESGAAWLATQSGLAPTGQIGLIGVSFSGGLAVVAAGRPSLQHRLRYVLSFGGHDDLRRVLEYFCTGLEGGSGPYARPGANAPARPPHDYGVAVVLLNVADHVVPPDQQPAFRDAVRRFLQASYLDVIDKAAAAREFSALRDVARTLPEPAATLLGYVNERDVAHLGPRLLPYVAAHTEPPALSPSRSPEPTAPVFLLHGQDDNVIPALESQYLADRLRGRVPVRLLLTSLISHAEADQPVHVADVVRLADFWGDVLAR